MVSNVLKIELQEFLETLERFRHAYANDPEYQALRGELPPEWPL
jgi:hypothetical protein